MSRRLLYPSLPVAIVILGAAYVLSGGMERLSAQRKNFPNFVGVGVPTVQVVTASQAAGPGVRFTAALNRNTNLDPPFNVAALPLASFQLVKADMSPDYSEACTLTNSATMLDCRLTPNPGPAWENGNPSFVRVRLTATDGHSAETLVNLSSGGAGAGFVTTSINAGTGPFPSTANGSPVYLTASLFRGVSTQSPFDSDALPLASSTLTPADFSPDFASACVFTESDTLLECILTPSPGPFWSAGGPLVVRARLTGVDGTSATQLVTFRIN